MRHSVRRHRDGLIDIADLPADCLSNPARPLTLLEGLERDAIVRALREQEGDVDAAADSLGMGGDDVRRKVRALGIVTAAFVR
ncbi:hypothetical protein VV01_19795 [Luteipulveratus halotolerans]|uniref:DNA binding HTH domain-containing protein n=1 Tax=Luteipulveratus halotolerans TaxID=1631356 RepID=A0A0L6CMB2_9MICO|nr:helix-turn-helix domain-containing protein [Luteipulveratus halotolerans]KNX38869.1 hypothetical protein VV01_19795 [Luteipulveratus halotolerans]